MQGSKYTDEDRQRFAALLLTGMSPTGAGAKLGIPKSTACCWAQRLKDESDEYAAERELERRRLVRRCMKVAGNAVKAIDQQIGAAVSDRKRIQDGLRVIAKAARDGVIALDEAEVKALRTIVTEHCDVSLRDVAATLKAIDEKQERLENELAGGANVAPELHVQLTMVEPDKKDTA